MGKTNFPKLFDKILTPCKYYFNQMIDVRASFNVYKGV